MHGAVVWIGCLWASVALAQAPGEPGAEAPGPSQSQTQGQVQGQEQEQGQEQGQAEAEARADAEGTLPLPGPAEEPATATPEARTGRGLAERAAAAAERRVEQVRANRAAVEEILSIGFSGDEAGELLREARRRAPEAAPLRRALEERARSVAIARLDRVRLLERRREADDAGNVAEVQRLSAELEEQQAYLDALMRAQAAEAQLADEAAGLVGLLDERLLWIGSAPPVGRAWVNDVVAGLRWGTQPAAWWALGQATIKGVAAVPLVAVLWTLVTGLLLFARPRLLRRLADLATGTSRHRTDGYGLTAEALGVTLLLALPLPLVIAGLAQATLAGSPLPFGHAVARGALAAAAVAFALGFFAQVCRPSGLAEAHFHWEPHARRTLWRHLNQLRAVEVPCALVVAATDAGGQEALRQGLGRAAFLVGALVLTAFVAVVFRTERGVPAGLLQPGSWAWRLRKPAWLALVAVPASLTLAAAAGYYFTATEVLGRFFTSGVVALLATVVYSLASRSVTLGRKRLAMDLARRRLSEARAARRAAAAAASEATGDGGRRDPDSPAASGDAEPELEEPEIDVEAVSGQTRTLLLTLVGVAFAAALYAVWADLLPALGFLSNFRVTPATLNSEGEVLVEGLTLWSLLLGAVTLALTWVAARNLPAVVELVVLQRVPIDAGTRYAVATLLRYAVVAAGLLTASRLVGIDWSKAQWIIAALGVGLGFGLQEIVANFVSGIIVLIERPVRVGDTVTVGQVSGTVSRLAIRATTITDWDNKEVLVPNKAYITDPVVNWTLSNGITRLLLPVGVAYGTDVDAAQAAMAAAVKSCPAVLAEPGPSVLFLGFGDSSLDFEVRCFVSELSKRLPTIHALNRAIYAELDRAGISIPFPQRDLHLHTPPEKGVTSL